MLKKIFKFLSSVKLALVLLAVIIIAVIKGTFYETSFNAEVARRYIYNAWWFNAWLAFLVVNLFCAAASRYPWKPHQTGFVITHAGIITLLIGGMIDRHWGIEGYVELFRGAKPTKIMQLHEEQLTLFTFDKSAVTNFNLKVILAYLDLIHGAPPTKIMQLHEEQLTLFKSAVTDFNLKSMSAMDDIHVHCNSPSPDVQVKAVDIYPPAAHLVLSGPTMGRQDQWLFLGDSSNMGPALMRFIRAKRVKRAERQLVFAKYEMPITTVMSGEHTGAAAKLVMNEEDSEPELHLTMQGRDFNFLVKPNIHKPLPLEGLDGWQMSIMTYYPDFKVTAEGVQSVSDKPNNPALVFELLGPEVISGESLEPLQTNDEKNPHGNGGYTPPYANAMSLYLDEDGKLYYYVRSRKLGESRGEVKDGAHVPLGWAGADFVVERFLPQGLSKALAHEDVIFPDQMMERINPGLLCELSANGKSKLVWVPHNRLRTRELDKPGADGKDYIINVPHEIAEVGGEKIELALTSKYVELPFTVGLKKFNAPYVPGMESRMEFAAFESVLSFDDEEDTVQLKPGYKLDPQYSEFVAEGSNPNTGIILRGAISDETDTTINMAFTDPQTSKLTMLELNLSDVARKEKHTQKISMNTPTTFPLTTYGAYTGTDYKFSQAGHDMPNNPDYSSVQVLRDPGWLFKWIGCLGICLGIFTMFYLKPYFKRAPATAMAAEKAGGTPAASSSPGAPPGQTEKNTKLASAGASELKKKVRSGTGVPARAAE